MKISDLCLVDSLKKGKCYNGSRCSFLGEPDGLEEAQCCLYCSRLETCIRRTDGIGCSAVQDLRTDSLSLIWLLAQRRRESSKHHQKGPNPGQIPVKSDSK